MSSKRIPKYIRLNFPNTLTRLSSPSPDETAGVGVSWKRSGCTYVLIHIPIDNLQDIDPMSQLIGLSSLAHWSKVSKLERSGSFCGYTGAALSHFGLYRVPIPIAPTYQLEPKQLFIPDQLENFTRDIVHDVVQKQPAHASHGTLAKALCNDVRAAIHGMGPNRYKYVVFCVVADNNKHSMLVASKCLWNKDFDDYLSVQCVENDFVVSLTVFASYMD
ncbi:unnamed protein product [Dibothriocephalus latus]|uniref:Uncharacterized protein n=1 Tax=Dibothriocephalus latus TaxID=60516 RepID=A0A3P6V7B7_DIBLA|nr:unnamed protein product [Dibothriocephalus latus]